jgi:hypothetical protein
MTTTLQTLIDRHEIHECLLRFCRSMDRFDRDLYLSAFHPDAEVAAGPYVGDAAGCYDWAMPLHAGGQVLTQHCLLNHNVDITGDTAHSEAYFLFAARNRDETVMLSGGRYLDRLERREGDWKIASRITLIEWSGLPTALPPPFSGIADMADNGLSARDTSDPSYQRPLRNRRALNRL